MTTRPAHPAIFWGVAGVAAIGVGLLIAVLLYLQVIFPLWDFFRPPIDSPDYEGAGELRMMWFCLGVGVIVAMGMLFGARRLRRH
jgi:hypothetical protein